MCKVAQDKRLANLKNIYTIRYHRVIVCVEKNFMCVVAQDKRLASVKNLYTIRYHRVIVCVE